MRKLNLVDVFFSSKGNNFSNYLLGFQTPSEKGSTQSNRADSFAQTL